MLNNVYSHQAGDPVSPEEQNFLSETEWLVTNGLGGYASGTVGGAPSRVFHGYLIAALPSPRGRTMVLNQLLETLVFPDGRIVCLSGLNWPGQDFPGSAFLQTFRLESGLPVWIFDVNGLTIEKRLVQPHRQNTTMLTYTVTAGSGSAEFQLRPAIHMRGHEAPVNSPLPAYAVSFQNNRFDISCAQQADITLRLLHQGDQRRFLIEGEQFDQIQYAVEHDRGYVSSGHLWSPGIYSAQIAPGSPVTLVASTESWDIVTALTPQEAWDAECDRKRRLTREADPAVCDSPSGEQLVWAADQFIFAPVGRREDTARARAAGDEVRSIIAGYHWFTDWGRDTMISLEGLTLATGRRVEASYILRTFAHYIRDGLIPNMFPEGQTDGLYHTADATLWFFHALGRYLAVTNDRHLRNQLLPKLLDVIGHHLRGTHFGIHVDPDDGLLVQGQDNYQLTWMDAKVDGWVVTPRRGKAVEINALWYNALRLLESWLREGDRHSEAEGVGQHAARAYESFNRRFWNPETGFLFDIVDGEDGGNDPVCRPNQLFAISLDHPVLDPDHWQAVVQVAEQRLLTPVGLRSLAPGEPNYRARYDGDLRSRDAAYHQGTVWAWLIGPFIDAWMRVHNDPERALTFLAGFDESLRSSCVGSINEIFDAEPPFTPRGCCAQAWSIAEVLRCSLRLHPSSPDRSQTTNLVAAIA